MPAVLIVSGLLLVLALVCLEVWYASKEKRPASALLRKQKGGRLCCHLKCRGQAEWLIVFGSGPLDYTEACTRHVGELLCDAKEQRIYPLEVRKTPEVTCLP